MVRSVRATCLTADSTSSFLEMSQRADDGFDARGFEIFDGLGEAVGLRRA